jgi:hypothetical protein
LRSIWRSVLKTLLTVASNSVESGSYRTMDLVKSMITAVFS